MVSYSLLCPRGETERSIHRAAQPMEADAACRGTAKTNAAGTTRVVPAAGLRQKSRRRVA